MFEFTQLLRGIGAGGRLRPCHLLPFLWFLMNAARPSMLISSVGWVNVFVGLAFVGFGVYVLCAGGDAVVTLYQMQTDVGKATNIVAAKEHAEQAKEAAGIFAKGLSGVILAFAFVIAGCSIVQGLPNLLVGVGVILR